MQKDGETARDFWLLLGATSGKAKRRAEVTLWLVVAVVVSQVSLVPGADPPAPPGHAAAPEAPGDGAYGGHRIHRELLEIWMF